MNAPFLPATPIYKMACPALITLFCFATACQQQDPGNKMPPPTNGIAIYHAHLDGEENGSNARLEWENMSHWAAPGTDWRKLDAETRQQLYLEKRKRHGKAGPEKTVESFANGQVSGEWWERGSLNQAGNLRTVDYEADEDIIYGIGDGGPIYRRPRNTGGWTLLHDDHQFDSRIFSVFPNGSGGKRIMTSIGMQLYYSDDQGATWSLSSGLTGNWQDWGPVQLQPVNEGANGVYFTALVWDYDPWDTRVKLFYSSDRGQSFTLIHTFPHNGIYYEANNFTRLWTKPGGTDLFAFHNSTDAGTYQITGSTVSHINTTVPFGQNVAIDFEGAHIGGTQNLWLLNYATQTLYKSTNQGLTWTAAGPALPTSPWSSVGVYASPFNLNYLFYGEVDCYRSFNQGSSWSQVNIWWEYYGNIDKLHADMMDIKAYQTTGGTQFVLIANHGGLHISYDNLVTTENLGETGLTISQYYDVRTDPSDPNYIYAGTQDQGHQRTAFGAGTGIVDFEQVISGDYGHMAFSNNGSSMWTVYPGGWVTYYHDPRTSGFSSDYQVTGSNLPVSGWINPTAETPSPTDNSIYIAGGNISGGSGSHVIQLTAQTTPPYAITSSQLGYDFMANSGGGTISAIAASTVNTSRMYVATSNGKFFYSNNTGASWTISPSFTGPPEFYVYGSCILPSKLNADLVWFAGSGYSNPGVYKSMDGGQTFSPMSNGLPNTLIIQVVANPEETALYAATEVGPYVYIVSEDQWYPLIGASTPIQRYYSVEYVSPNILRFGTYGRGAWQFNITNQPTACPEDLVLAQDPIPTGNYSASNSIIFKGRVPSGADVNLLAPNVTLDSTARVDMGGVLTTDQSGCTPSPAAPVNPVKKGKKG